MMRGTVLWSMNNIFSVRTGAESLECRLKGKRLEGEDVYNPLAPGDLVELTRDGSSGGLIHRRLPRKNSFQRWNRKKQSLQTMAANVDILLIISSLKSPPFRPRFLDRILISARWNQIEPVIVVNKADFPMELHDRDRIEDYDNKHSVIICSAKTGRGIEDVKNVLNHKRAVLIGQSGAGKSSIINRLNPELHLRTGEISEKYNRGKHTTNYAVLLEWQKGSEIIDTPGIREIDLNGIPDENIRDGFAEFAAHSEKCGFSTCSHIHEPDCAVRGLVEDGLIHPDRYQSYINIISERSGR